MRDSRSLPLTRCSCTSLQLGSCTVSLAGNVTALEGMMNDVLELAGKKSEVGE